MMEIGSAFVAEALSPVHQHAGIIRFGARFAE